MALRGWANRRVSLLTPMQLLQRLRLSCAAATWWPFSPMAALAESMKNCHAAWKNCAAYNEHDHPGRGILPNTVGAGFLDHFYSACGFDRIPLDANHRQD